MHQYITLNHPHVIVGVMTIFDSMTSKQDYANHRELYARLIAGDIIHSNQHMAEIDALLALPE